MDSWRGPFFPAGLPVKSQLQYYASQFETAELNGVFYRTPTRDAVKSWKEQTGTDFVFTWKASKFITHWKRLSAKSVNSLELLEDRLSILEDKAGPILFQLPPNFQADADRLASFLKCFREKDATVLSSDIRVGTQPQSCACWLGKTFRFAYPTTMMRLHPGNAQRTLSTFGDMARAGTIKVTIPQLH